MAPLCYNNLIMSKGVVTRFAPSPTGLFHVGSYRTALFSYIFALQNKGKFILRIEDTDKERSKREYEDEIINSLKWLNIKYDEFFRQSDRTEIYKSYIKKLIDSGNAFISKEIPKEVHGRQEVIRFKNTKKKVIFNDLIRGEIEFDTTELGDFVIAKSVDEPLFHLVVVIDDFLMGISHIIRGEDHISNTPRQILIQEALGFSIPLYAHIPLVLAKDRSKLSKRKGALAISEYSNGGYLRDALINYMVLLGWNPGTSQEIMSFEEIMSQFKLEKVQKSGAIFDEEKLKWINKKYIEKLDEKDFLKYATKFLPKNILVNISVQVLLLIKEKIHTFAEIPALLDGELSFIKPLPSYQKESLKWKQEKNLINTKKYLKSIIDNISVLNDFTKESIKSAVWSLAEEKGKGNVLWPMRFALSAMDKSPDPFIISEILGKEETLKRLTFAHDLL